MDSRASYYRLNISNRVGGKLLQEKAFTSRTPSGGSSLHLDVSHSRPFLHVIVNASGSKIITGDHVGHLYLFDVEAGSFKLITRLGSCVTALAFVEEQNETGVNLIAATAQHQTLHFLRLSSSGACHEVAFFSAIHKSAVNCLSVCQTQLISSATFNCAVLWDLDKLSVVKQLSDDRLVRAVFASTSVIAAAYKGSRVYLFDAISFEVRHIVEEASLIGSALDFGKVLLRDERLATVDLMDAEDVDDSRRCTLRLPSSVRKVDLLGSITSFVALDANGTFILGGDHLDRKNSNLDSGKKFTAYALSESILVGITVSGGLQVFDLRCAVTNEKRDVRRDERAAKTLIEDKAHELRALELAEELIAKYRRFPSKYRFYIWSQLLRLPLDNVHYALIKSRAELIASDAEVKVLLSAVVNKYKVTNLELQHGLLKTLRQLIASNPNLIRLMNSLPLLVFPFVKLLPKNNVFRFELLSAVIRNELFKYDRETANRIRSTLASESTNLVSFYSRLAVSDEVYAKSLFESVFSDIFLKDDWLILFDNVLAGGHDFVVSAVLAVNLIGKDAIMRLPSAVAVEMFFREQRGLDLKNVLRMAYRLFESPATKSSIRARLGSERRAFIAET